MQQLSETQALKQIDDELKKLRTFSHKGWCSKCHEEGMIVRTDVMTCETECTKCYAKRRWSELDPVPDDKIARADQVRLYFKKRRDATGLL